MLHIGMKQATFVLDGSRISVPVIAASEAPLTFHVPQPHGLDHPLSLRRDANGALRPLMDSSDTLRGDLVSAPRDGEDISENLTLAGVISMCTIIDGAVWIRCPEPGYRVRAAGRSVRLSAELIPVPEVNFHTTFAAHDQPAAIRAAQAKAIEVNDLAGYLQAQSLPGIISLHEPTALTAQESSALFAAARGAGA